jgi:signal peptidase II
MQRLPNNGVVLIEGYFEFRYAENCGAAFGLLRDADDSVRRIVFGLAALGATVALFWMFVVGKGGPLFAWSVPFVVSGAVGNLIDRIRYGYVVDFIRFHVYDKFEYPTFNVADITIVIGVGLLLLDGFRKEGGSARASKPEAPPDAKGTKGGSKKKRDGAVAEG